MSFSMIAMMSPMLSLTRGSKSGSTQPSSRTSFWYSAAKRAERSVGTSPRSFARLRILSSTSVTLRTYVTFAPWQRRWRTTMSGASAARAWPTWATS